MATVSLRAARPVGASRRIFRSRASAIRARASVRCVLPVPGPPVITERRRVSALIVACRWALVQVGELGSRAAACSRRRSSAPCRPASPPSQRSARQRPLAVDERPVDRRAPARSLICRSTARRRAARAAPRRSSRQRQVRVPALLRLAQGVDRGRPQPLRRARVDAAGEGEPVGAEEADPRDRGQRVGVVADLLGGVRFRGSRSARRRGGQPVRGEQRVEPALGSAVRPLLGRLGGPRLAEPLSARERGLRDRGRSPRTPPSPWQLDQLVGALERPIPAATSGSGGRRRCPPGRAAPPPAPRAGGRGARAARRPRPSRAREPSSRWPSGPTAQSGVPSCERDVDDGELAVLASTSGSYSTRDLALEGSPAAGPASRSASCAVRHQTVEGRGAGWMGAAGPGRRSR